MTGRASPAVPASGERGPSLPTLRRRARRIALGDLPVASTLDQYLREIAAFPLLSPLEEGSLAQRIRAGDREALDTLVCANLRFVVTIAKRYQHHGVALADLINEGNIGLLRAAPRFEEGKGGRFISYAVWWVRQAIIRSLAELGRPVRVPPGRANLVHRIGKRANALRHELGREPTHAEIREAMNVTRDEAATAITLCRTHVSLDARATARAGSRWIDRLVGGETPAADEEAGETALVAAVETALAALPAREASVVRLYFGLDRDEPMTLEQIGGMFGVTRERVRQIKGAALAKLRCGPVGTTLAQFH